MRRARQPRGQLRAGLRPGRRGGKHHALAQDQCGWFAKDQSRSCPSCSGATRRRCGRRARRGRGVLAGDRREAAAEVGPTLHFSAVLYLALHGHLGLNREAPPPLGRADCAVVHVRRGDACVNTNRRCHSNDEYVEAARQLKDAYGLESLRVVSDDGNLPLDRWRRLGYDVEVLSRSEAYDVSRSVAGAAKSLRDHFPEKRMARGELGPTATQDALRDMLGPRTLECRAPRGNIDQPSAPAYSSSHLIAAQVARSSGPFRRACPSDRPVADRAPAGPALRPRRRLRRQARFFDADAEGAATRRARPRRPSGGAAGPRRCRGAASGSGGSGPRHARDPPVCAAKLPQKRGVWRAGADLGAAAAVCFTAVVNTRCTRAATCCRGRRWGLRTTPSCTTGGARRQARASGRRTLSRSGAAGGAAGSRAGAPRRDRRPRDAPPARASRCAARSATTRSPTRAIRSRRRRLRDAAGARALRGAESAPASRRPSPVFQQDRQRQPSAPSSASPVSGASGCTRRPPGT